MFELATPWVLYLLPLPLLIWFLLPRVSSQLPAALKIPFFSAILNIVGDEKRHLFTQTKIGILGLIWALLLFAIAGPRWVGEPHPVAREGRNIMMALDLSGSMELRDMYLHRQRTTRLAVVKQAAEQFVRDRAGDKIGLILFGARAYLQTPLTYDHQNVLMRIADATAGLAGKTTSIGDALGLSVKRLQDVPPEGRVIILLTDGANNSGVLPPLKAAELARADGIKVYTIGLGAKSDPRAINDIFFNMNPSADLDEKTLKKIADMTGGRYFRATNMQSLQNIYKRINQLETIKQEQETIRPQHDYYPWPLAFALFLLFYWLADSGGLFVKIRLFPNQRIVEQ